MQIIVDAQAHGTGSEQALLLPVIQAIAALRNADTVITADAGFNEAANLKALDEQEINAYMPPSPIRCGTKPNTPSNPSASSPPISAWQKIIHTAYVRRASSCMAMDRIAPSTAMRQ